jgi:hypothetical protein
MGPSVAKSSNILLCILFYKGSWYRGDINNKKILKQEEKNHKYEIQSNGEDKDKEEKNLTFIDGKLCRDLIRDNNLGYTEK